jgi:hypothetical protein
MGCLLVDRAFPLDILTPTDKTEAGIRGYTKELLLGYFTNTVAPELIAMNRQHIVVCMDKGLAPTKQQVIDAFMAGGYNTVDDVIIYPTDTGKYLNPLDNTLWHTFKDRIRKVAPTTEQQIITSIHNSWNAITTHEINNYYHHCALYRGQDPYTGHI